MDFFDLLQKRRATHHFLPDQPLPDADFKKMVDAASLTPSGYNAQPWEFILIRDKARLKAMEQIAYRQPHIAEASGAVVVLGDMEIGRHAERILKDWLDYGYMKKEEWPAYLNSMQKKRTEDKRREMALRNSGLAAMTFMLAAEALGYATCPMMGFYQWKLEEFLGIPKDRAITLVIAVGKADPGKEKPRLPRKKAEEVIHLERFGGSF